MIIDCILDAKDDPESYDAKEFYDYVMESPFTEFRYIASALDSGSNEDVREALCTYIDSQNYNPEIKDFVNSFDWLCARVRYCVDIFSGNDDAIYRTMTICALVKHSDGVFKCEVIENYSMSEDDMKVVTGIDDIEEIENTSDLDLARIIAENSQPYGFVGLPDHVCDYYSAGITHYHNVKPQRLNQ